MSSVRLSSVVFALGVIDNDCVCDFDADADDVAIGLVLCPAVRIS